MSAITTGGKLVHYEVLGRGRPVILLHGWLGSWRYWIPTLQVLQNNYRVYAIDFFGFGDSAKDADYYTLDRQISLLNDFMSQLAIPKAALIGHGLGAMVAAEFARRAADRIPRLMISSAPLYDPGDLDRRTPAAPARKTAPAAAQSLDAAAAAAAATTNTSTTATSALRAALAEAARVRGVTGLLEPRPDYGANPPARRNPLLPVMNNSPENLLGKCFRKTEPSYEKLRVDVAKIDPPALRKSAESFDAGRLLDTLRLLSMPVVVVHGSDDPLIPQPSEEILNYLTLDRENSLLPILLPNVRHFPMLEDDRFARLASEFLEAADISRLEIKERWRRRTR